MRRVTRAVLVGLSLCFVLFVGSILWLSYRDYTALPMRLYHQAVLGDKDFTGKGIRFRVWGMGTRLAANGSLADFTSVRASDCVRVISETESLSTPTEAETEMGKRVHGASRVVERGATFDLDGHPDGERAVLLFEGDRRAEIVIGINGKSWLHTIESTSLAHALAYEKLTQRGHRLDPDGYVIASGQ